MKNKKSFIRISALTTVVTLCIIFGFAGICVSYENTRAVAYGDYRHAIEISKDGVRILDFEIDFVN